MGLFDFVKDAGEKLFGRPEVAKAQKPVHDPVSAEALSELIETLGFQVSSLNVTYANGLATITGFAKSPEDIEKITLVLGNTRGVAQVDNQLQLEKELGPEYGPAMPPPATMYTVKSGDSLSKIARTHYGDANKYMAIFEANRPMLKDPNKIFPGQVLRIPAQDAPSGFGQPV